MFSKSSVLSLAVFAVGILAAPAELDKRTLAACPLGYRPELVPYPGTGAIFKFECVCLKPVKDYPGAQCMTPENSADGRCKYAQGWGDIQDNNGDIVGCQKCSDVGAKLGPLGTSSLQGCFCISDNITTYWYNNRDCRQGMRSA